jgi:hypothetical protein
VRSAFGTPAFAALLGQQPVGYRAVWAIAGALLTAALLATPGVVLAAPAPAAKSTAAKPASSTLIPRAILFAGAQRFLPRMSPDGSQISWIAPGDSGVFNVWARPAGVDKPRPVTHEKHRPIFFYAWVGGQHLLYLHDNGGDENNHLFLADLETGTTRDLTPYPGVRAQDVNGRPASDRVLMALSKQDPRVFDMPGSTGDRLRHDGA